MKKGTNVTWVLKNGLKGTGITIADEDGGRILVAVDPAPHAADGGEMHFVIWCTVTWLTEIR